MMQTGYPQTSSPNLWASLPVRNRRLRLFQVWSTSNCQMLIKTKQKFVGYHKKGKNIYIPEEMSPANSGHMLLPVLKFCFQEENRRAVVLPAPENEWRFEELKKMYKPVSKSSWSEMGCTLKSAIVGQLTECNLEKNKKDKPIQLCSLYTLLSKMNK